MKIPRIYVRTLSALLSLGICVSMTACGQETMTAQTTATTQEKAEESTADALKPTKSKAGKNSLVAVPAPKATTETTKEQTPAPAQQDATYNDSLITEVCSTDGSDVDEYGAAYLYHIPQIVDDTEAAKAINAEILTDFDHEIKAVQKKDWSGIYWHSVTWQSRWNGSLLSLYIFGDSSIDGIDYHGVYHYDFESGKQLTNTQMLEHFGVDAEEFMTALRKKAAWQIDSEYAPQAGADVLPKEWLEYYPKIYLAYMRAFTISNNNLELDKLAVYPNSDGTFTAYPFIKDIETGYYQEVTVKLEPNEWAAGNAPQSEYAFIQAKLTGDGASVRFKKSNDGIFDSEESRQHLGFEYDTDYPIAACCADYQDIFVGVFGQGMSPYVMLLTKEGTVEYVNVFSGLEYNCLCSGGPVFGLHDIVGFENDVVKDEYGGGYQTIYAVDKLGEKYDLAELIVEMENSVPSAWDGQRRADIEHKVASGSSYQDTNYITFHTDGLIELYSVWEDSLSIGHGGYCTYLGMTEDGMIYRFRLYSDNPEDDEAWIGAFALCNNSDLDLEIKHISGVNLFDSGEGGSTVFKIVNIADQYVPPVN